MLLFMSICSLPNVQVCSNINCNTPILLTFDKIELSLKLKSLDGYFTRTDEINKLDKDWLSLVLYI